MGGEGQKRAHTRGSDGGGLRRALRARGQRHLGQLRVEVRRQLGGDLLLCAAVQVGEGRRAGAAARGGW